MHRHLELSGTHACQIGQARSASCQPRCCNTAGAHPQRKEVHCTAQSSSSGGSTPEHSQAEANRRAILGASFGLAAASQLSWTPAALAAQVVSKDWEKVDLPVGPEIVLLDVAFTPADPNHGFLLGSRQTLLETKDGGKSWTKRDISAAKEEGFNFRFTSISFQGDEGWIVGKPAILLHTADGGKTWERVALSDKLPGDPVLITAVEGKNGQAEMTTNQGAVYVTDNAAQTWKAAVQETVDATLNRTVSSGISGASYYEGSFSTINRSPSGDYVAVSSRGNFYMTWTPGQAFWQPHNRPSARRIQNMGWTADNTLWLATRGGDVFFANKQGQTSSFEQSKLGSRGFGILDVTFRDKGLGFACGGSGSLYRTDDGGSSWKRDRSTDQIEGNLYAIKWSPGGQGFILGNAGILLRYIDTA